MGGGDEAYVVYGRLCVYLSPAASNDLPCKVGLLPLSVNPSAEGALMKRVGSILFFKLKMRHVS